MKKRKDKQNLFGRLVRMRRDELKLTLSQLAKKVGTHKGYISGIEWGKVNPPAAKMTARYARVLKFDVLDLIELGEVVKMPPQVLERMLGRIKDNPLLAQAWKLFEAEQLALGAVKQGPGNPEPGLAVRVEGPAGDFVVSGSEVKDVR